MFLCNSLALAPPCNGELTSPLSSRSVRPPASPVDPAAMWRDVKSLIANEMAKMNEKIEGISQKLSSLEAKVLALEAGKETVAPKDPKDAVKWKRTPLCLQVCYMLPLMSVESTALSLYHVYNTRFVSFNSTEQNS